MSNRLINAALGSDLDPTTRFVLVVCANIAQNDGSRVYPSTRKLQALTGYGERTIYESLARLKRLGILVPIGKMSRNVVHYRLIESAIPRQCTPAPDAGFDEDEEAFTPAPTAGFMTSEETANPAPTAVTPAPDAGSPLRQPQSTLRQPQSLSNGLTTREPQGLTTMKRDANTEETRWWEEDPDALESELMAKILRVPAWTSRSPNNLPTREFVLSQIERGKGEGAKESDLRSAIEAFTDWWSQNEREREALTGSIETRLRRWIENELPRWVTLSTARITAESRKRVSQSYEDRAIAKAAPKASDDKEDLIRIMTDENGCERLRTFKVLADLSASDQDAEIARQAEPLIASGWRFGKPAPRAVAS